LLINRINLVVLFQIKTVFLLILSEKYYMFRQDGKGKTEKNFYHR
jgi:hypothetical protein